MAEHSLSPDMINPEFVAQFYARVRKIKHPEACWIWTGPINDNGFGFLRTGKKRLAAHRVAWELEHGPIPAARVLKQECNCRACVRTDHMKMVNTKQRRKRAQDGCSVYVRNLQHLTPSLFDDRPYSDSTQVRVVFGDDAKQTVKELAPLLSTLGRAVGACTEGQTKVVKEVQAATRKLSELESLAARLAGLEAQVHDFMATMEVSRETFAAVPPDAPTKVSRETLAVVPPDNPTKVSRETFAPAPHDDTPGIAEAPHTAPELRVALTQVVAQAFGVPFTALDSYAIAQVYELAREREGMAATEAFRSWVESYVLLIERQERPPQAGELLRWAMGLSESGGSGPLGPAGATGPGPASSPRTSDTPAPSSPHREPGPAPTDPGPA